jgi:hypothetical protein
MNLLSAILAAALLTTTGVWADDVTPNVTSAADVQKLVPVKHVQASDPQVESLIRTLGVRATGPIAGYIVLKGPKDAVAAAEEVLQKMDLQKPSPDIEVTGWVVVASSRDTGLQPLPPVLQPVAKQLNTAFGYSNLKLLTSFVVRTHAGAAGRAYGQISAGSLGSKNTDNTVQYQFEFRNADLSTENGGVRTIRLHQLRLYMSPANIDTDVDLVEGQKVVVGKTSVAYGEETPIMLVLSAHVVGE